LSQLHPFTSEVVPFTLANREDARKFIRISNVLILRNKPLNALYYRYSTALKGRTGNLDV
jgi:hypothetical protein